jgi:hypothetical protein
MQWLGGCGGSFRPGQILPHSPALGRPVIRLHSVCLVDRCGRRCIEGLLLLDPHEQPARWTGEREAEHEPDRTRLVILDHKQLIGRGFGSPDLTLAASKLPHAGVVVGPRKGLEKGEGFRTPLVPLITLQDPCAQPLANEPHDARSAILWATIRKSHSDVFLSGPRSPEHEALLRLIGGSILDPQRADENDPPPPWRQLGPA